MNSYSLGTLVRLEGTFVDEDGAPADPDTVLLGVQPVPGGDAEWWTWTEETPGTMITHVALDVGHFTANYLPPASGHYRYRWVGVGAVDTAGDQAFYVRAAGVAPAPS